MTRPDAPLRPAAWLARLARLGRAAVLCGLAANAGLGAAQNPTPTPAPAPAGDRQVRYLSPQGDDGAAGTTPERPWRSFSRAFSRLQSGGELVLLDGLYSEATGTGIMSYKGGRNSAQIPSGTPARSTLVRALNPGQVTVAGELFMGRSTRKDSYITVQGLTFEGGGSLYNTSFVTIKDSGFHGAFGMGTNDHDNGNTDNLVEDVWVWASGERGISMNYRSHRNVWRRVVIRGDGCGTPGCAGSGNPNIGFTVYDSHDVSVQNVMVLDRILAPTDSPYADFSIASHTGGLYTFGRNEWLGTISMNAPDIAYYMEPDRDTTEDPTIRISNAVAWNAGSGAFNLARYATNTVVENVVAHTLRGDGIRIAPDLGPLGVTLRNVVVLGAGRYAVNSAQPATNVVVHGTWASPFNQTRSASVLPGNPRADGSLKYLTRVEPRSPLSGKGTNRSDVGATILARYGTDGTRFGEKGYNTLTAVALWPWPNEERIKREMCASTPRGFCSPGKRLDGSNPITLTSYVWEALGNPLPRGIYP